jgi:amyloid beta precursor protein binding protein 1
MKAQSKVYIQLQNIYKAKARQDAAEVLETAHALAPGREFDPAEVELFCKNAPFVKLVNATGGKGSVAISSDDRLRNVTGKFIFFASRIPLCRAWPLGSPGT